MNYKVLHFDDEPFISRAFDQNLELLGWNVRLVSEIDELFRELQNNQYDILIMNIMAPTPPLENEHVTFTQKEIDEMNGGINTGVILTEIIWRMGKYKDIPVLFLSARIQPEKMTLYQSFGHRCAYLRLPELAKTVDRKLIELLNR